MAPGLLNEPYTELAALYDRVMDHVDYRAWACYIDSLLERFGESTERILELACGTASFMLELDRLGYHVTGSDHSHAMLVRAREKLLGRDIPRRLFTADMDALPLRVTFDAVLCLYDSLNYLTDTDRFRAAIHGAAEALAPGGLFVFDVCTVKNSELFFSHNTISEDFGDIRYERTCRYDRVKHIQENHFTIIRDGRRFHESHYQRIYRLDEIEEMIAGSPFDRIALFNDMTFHPGSEDSERVHYVLRRM